MSRTGVQRLQRRAEWTAEHLDAAGLSQDEAVVSLEALARTENAVAAMKAAVALRLADSDVWRTEGDRSTKDEVAEVWGMVRHFADAAFRAARSDGRIEGHDAYAADGMLRMARAAAGGGGNVEGNKPRRVPTKVIVRIDWDALVRGYPIEGETCEISGIGPVPVGIVRHLIESGDIFLAAVVTQGSEVASAVHFSRKARSMQRTALEWLDPECPVEGCNQSSGLEIDHREDWADTKITLVSLLDRPCPYHHRLKTRYGWALVAGRGKRKMVPPGHP